jgi:Fe-S-cluster-containing hydrogenase component 2
MASGKELPMGGGVYEHLAQALNELPEGFPRTETGVELKILMKMYSTVEAHLGSYMSHNMDTLSVIAARVGVPEKEIAQQLDAMMEKGKVWGRKFENEGLWKYRLAPFIPGSYEEYIVATRDEEMLHLMTHYADEGGLGIMVPIPALQRVIPSRKAIGPDEILPYDDVKKLILKAKSFSLFDCTCRVGRDMKGDRKCDFPIHNCLQMYYEERAPGPNTISREKALDLLDEAEDVGLVHTGTNYIDEMHWICNCCGCCCNLIRNLVEIGLDGALARANYYAVIETNSCVGCETCLDRCPVDAICIDDQFSAIDRNRCIGCGLCVTGCPADALALRRKPDAEIEDPPVDEAEYSRKRLRNRGLL